MKIVLVSVMVMLSLIVLVYVMVMLKRMYVVSVMVMQQIQMNVFKKDIA